MIKGLLSGILWGLDTTLLSIVLASASFNTSTIIFFAPFISTFLHDFFSAIWMSIFTIYKKDYVDTIKLIKTRSGKFIILASLFAGPIGMTCYLLAIKYLGPSLTAIISGFYPAFGALLSFLILKEKLHKYNILGLIISISGVIMLGYFPENNTSNFIIGFICALGCVLGWGSEAVILSYGMKDDKITSNQALLLRQLTSSLTYCFIIIPLISGINVTINVFKNPIIVFIAIIGLIGTLSYTCYYKAINIIGPTKAMSLNITYSAWAMIFSFIILQHDLTIKSITLCLVIIVGSILASINFNHQKDS